MKLAYFFGEVCAKAFMERIVVPICFNHTITRFLLGQEPRLEDLVTYDKMVRPPPSPPDLLIHQLLRQEHPAGR